LGFETGFGSRKTQGVIWKAGHPMRRKIVPAQEDRTAERLLPVITRKSNVNGARAETFGQEDRLCPTEAVAHTEKV
jgi:hypothetical protein